LAFAREALEIAERIGSAVTLVWARTSVAQGYVGTGDYDTAIRFCSDAWTFAQQSHSGTEWETRIHVILAEARLAMGDREAALGTVNEAIEAAGRRGTFLWEIYARLTAARVLLAEGEAHSAAIREHLERAAALIDSAGAKALKPFLCLETAKQARVDGDEAAYGSGLAEASRLFLEVGAPRRAFEIRESFRS
jgi:ATP/maltotriose-dependent transcriptional regulator MalT